ncbi:hypothetical protein E4T45_11532, partial [Aureobasidium sp. EXF-8846]
MKLAETRPEYFDTEKLGVPINDMDCVGTIVSFSSALIYISLPRQGIYLRAQEIEDYTALWRYIAYVIGCPTDGLLETKEQSRRILDSIMMHEIAPTRTSQILANNVIRSLADKPPGYASADFLIAGARWLNGNKLCDALALPRPSIYYTALMAGQCIFFGFWCYTNRMNKSTDQKKLVVLRDIFWKIIVKGGLKGEETNFDFKYVPEYSIMTEMGGVEEVKLSKSEIEIASLKWLLMGVAVVSVVGFVVTKVGFWGARLATWGVKSAWNIGSKMKNTTIPLIHYMQRFYGCHCSVRALEAFVRDVAGLDIRQRRNITFRNLSTRSTLQVRHSSPRFLPSQAHGITSSLDDTFVPFETSTRDLDTTTTHDNSSESLPTGHSNNILEAPEPFDPDEEPGSLEDFEPEIVIHQEQAQTKADPIVREARIHQSDLRDRDLAIDAIFFPDLLADPKIRSSELGSLSQRLNIFSAPTPVQQYPGKNSRKKARRAAENVEAPATQGEKITKRTARVAKDEAAILQDTTGDQETISVSTLSAKAASKARAKADRKAKRAALALEVQTAILEQAAQDQETADVASLIASATGPKPISQARADKIALAIKTRKAEEKAAKKAAAEKLVEEQAAAKQAQKERNRSLDTWKVQKAALEE